MGYNFTNITKQTAISRLSSLNMKTITTLMFCHCKNMVRNIIFIMFCKISVVIVFYTKMTGIYFYILMLEKVEYNRTMIMVVHLNRVEYFIQNCRPSVLSGNVEWWFTWIVLSVLFKTADQLFLVVMLKWSLETWWFHHDLADLSGMSILNVVYR